MTLLITLYHNYRELCFEKIIGVVSRARKRQAFSSGIVLSALEPQGTSLKTLLIAATDKYL